MLAVAAAIMLILAAAPGVHGQGLTLDRNTSEALTGYLRQHRLPLVGASVSRGSDGSTQVMLYGFVASEKGKRDAAVRAAKYFHNNPRLTVVNRISVNPEIRRLGSGNTTSPGSGTAAAPSAEAGSSSLDELSWEKVYREIQQNGIHPAPDPGDLSNVPW